MRFCGKLNFKLCGWRESARLITLDTTIPVLALPIFMIIAAQSFIHTLIIFLLTPLLIYYLHRNFLRFLTRTKFFFAWTITSVLALLLVFEISVVPLLEILPEENLVFVIFVLGAFFSAYMTRLRAEQLKTKVIITEELELGKENVCSLCKNNSPAKLFHCRLCEFCVPNQEYHCKWLDCCIAKTNTRWYISCLFFTAVALIYGGNLTTTTICHPFIFFGTILLPNDCTDVYYQLDTAISFVSAAYSLAIGLILMAYLIYRLWLITAKKFFKIIHVPDREIENGSDGDGGFKKMQNLLL